MASETTSFEILLDALAAAGEPTRLRLLALLAEAELTVTELVTILGQSQPRISRHLKLLLEGRPGRAPSRGRLGLLSGREHGADRQIARPISSRRSPRRMRRARPTAAGSPRCAAPAPSRPPAISPPMRRIGTSSARCISARNGSKLPLRSSSAGRRLTPSSISAPAPGRMLELVAPRAERAVGIDQSPQMLALARARIEKAGLRNVQLRQGDIYALPVEQRPL